MSAEKDGGQTNICESGFSLLSLMCALPVICIFLFSIVDSGRIIMLNTSLHNASASVCRHLEASPNSSDTELLSIALQASPSLATETLSIKTAYEPVVDSPYTHHLYDLSTDKFTERTAHVQTRAFSITLTLSGHFITLLGTSFAQTQGHQNGSFEFSATQFGEVDTTIEGGSW